MTYFEWVERYKPIKNPLDCNASYDGCMFETYGLELEHIKTTPFDQVWTFVSDGEHDSIINGYSYVNRMGYFVTEVRWPARDIIEVNLDD